MDATRPARPRSKKAKVNIVFTIGRQWRDIVLIRLPTAKPIPANHRKPHDIISTPRIIKILGVRLSKYKYVTKACTMLRINTIIDTASATFGRIVFFFACGGRGGGVVMTV